MKNPLGKLLVLGCIIEILIFVGAYLMQPSLEETFRHAARYSGRLSLVVFMIAFYLFAFGYPKPIKENFNLKNWTVLFAVIHIIHFGFLATNVVLNKIPIVPIKLTGGVLAYLMIVCAPLVLHKLKLGWQLVYFYYVSIVMIVTYVARVKGDFEGAEPFWFHYLALSTLVFCCLLFGWKIWKATKN